MNYKLDIEDIETKHDPLLNQSEEHLEEEYDNEQVEAEMEEEQEPDINEREESETREPSQNERFTRSDRRRSDQHHEHRRNMSSPGMPRGPRFSHLPEWQRVSSFLILISVSCQ